MNAKELMKKQCQEYFDSAIKTPLVPHGEGSVFEDDNFVAQCFDDIQNDVMREIHDGDYYDHVGSGDEVDQDYNDTCEVRMDFTRDAIEFVAEAIESKKA